MVAVRLPAASAESDPFLHHAPSLERGAVDGIRVEIVQREIALLYVRSVTGRAVVCEEWRNRVPVLVVLRVRDRIGSETYTRAHRHEHRERQQA
jgi:hypothetical protein